ncbi:RNA 2',3'-cyclic phosphodiesterase [Altericroceibacterium endophyticum]|uniref:RNA 2',3'-cyclic phosphodiesterase n=1 Tax=Altericroceibacterium endophyticum TaxID=1808508 RepID=A0A6I4T472_9SPHN|nr:RNA 2',3'-cyclic phosphodiesterase [Altericroceibacterium endophyticum]MXO66074.1 RNA 2',3'-cyclic phosphodiesterase [Altericroceibacterium endophyticum]
MTENQRLFVGITPPPVIRANLTGRMKGVTNARWQNDAQLHLTLRFLGDMDLEARMMLERQLAGIKAKPFSLRLEGAGQFTHGGRPHALFAGIGPSLGLALLQEATERSAQSAGLEPEARPYRPHITLARLNTSSGPTDHFISSNGGLSSAPFRVTQFTLYESRLTPEGSIYKPLRHFPLRG